MSKTEVATQENKELAVHQKGDWGAGKDVDANDILIPKILCAQAISKAVTQEEVKLGEFYDSVEKQVLATYDRKNEAKTQDLEIIVFGTFKHWVINHDGEYHETVPFQATVYDEDGKVITQGNDQWAYEETVDKVEIQRDNVMNFYCVLPKEIKEDPTFAFPYVLPLKRTSRKAGQKITTRITKLAARNRPSACQVFKLSRTIEMNKQKKEYFVVDAVISRDATDEEMAAAYKWWDALDKKKVNVKIDDSDYREDSKNGTVNASSDY